MGRVCVVLLLALALSGCGLAARKQAEEQAKQLQAQSDAATEACKSRFVAADPKTFVDRIRCLNDAAMIALPNAGSDQDLLLAFWSERLVTAEHVRDGKMTLDEGSAAIAASWSRVVSESQNRRNARIGVAAQVAGAAAAQQSAAAQQQAASAAAMRALNPPMRAPVTCMTTGTMTTCN
jgi:hypothetical protein